MQPVLQYVGSIVLLSIALVTAADYLVHRTPQRRDACLMFASLGLVVILQGAYGALGGQPSWLMVVASISALAQPYLLLRLVSHVRHVSFAALSIALAGMVASWAGILIFPESLPAALLAMIILYVGGLNAYAGVLCLRDVVAPRSAGWDPQLRYAAWGSLLMATAIVFAGAAALVPTWSETTVTLTRMFTIGSGLCYFWAFAPPHWIRQVWQDARLSRQVVTLVVLGTVLTASCVAIAVASQFQKATLQQVERSQISIVQASAHVVDAHLVGTRNALSLVAERIVVQQAVSTDRWDLRALYRALDDIKAYSPSVSNVFITDAEGFSRANVFRDPSTIGLSFADREYFRVTAETRAPYISNPYMALRPAGPTVAAAAPIFDPNGNLRAVIAANFDMSVLEDAFRFPGVTDSSRILIVAPASAIELHPDGHARIVSVPEEMPRLSDIAEAGSRTVPLPGGGQDRLIAYAATEQLGWGTMIVTPVDDVLAPLTTATVQATALALALIVVLAAAAGLLATRLFEPLGTLTAAVSRVGAGELETKVQVRGAADVRALAEEFNAMGDALAQRRRLLSRHAAELEVLVRERTEALDGLAAANKELEAFTYTVAHDLRAPLRAMDGFSKILEEEHGGELSPEAQRYVTLVRQNAVQMGRLVDDLLEFSRLGRKPLSVQSVDLKRLAHEAFDQFGAERDGRNVELVVDELPAAEGDPALLRQVYVNLIGNALKFTRGRDPARIEVGYLRNGSGTEYFVRDNGVGFDMRYADKLFRVFQRLHRARDYEGTGVGLATVHRVIDRHGGRVWADSTLGKGTTFYFTLGDVASHDGE